MKRVIAAILFVLLLCSCFPSSQKSEKPPLIYADNNVAIYYKGISEAERLWMTNSGMTEKKIQSVVLEITNYTETAFFISGSTLIVDGIDVSPVSATLKIWANTSFEYEYCAENLDNLDPTKIQLSLYVFDINTPEAFTPYDIELNFAVAN